MKCKFVGECLRQKAFLLLRVQADGEVSYNCEKLIFMCDADFASSWVCKVTLALGMVLAADLMEAV